MTQWFQWIILTALTGSPVVSAVILLVVWFLVDRFTLGVLPDPFRWVMRLRRAAALERVLMNNTHDRRARAELGELYVARKKYARAMELLRPNLEAGDEAPGTVFTLGVACLGAGHAPQGEKLLEHVEELEPNFRVGEVDLVRGRFRLARKEYGPAKEALERLVQSRKGTVEGRVLLARALQGLGDDGKAALLLDEAWAEYVAAPRFQRRKERLWAWRARPSRPLLYLAFVVAGLFLLAKVVGPSLGPPDEYGG